MLESLPWPLVLALNVGCAALGAVAEWHWARVGMNLEYTLLTGAEAVEVPLAKLVVVAVVLGALGVPLQIALLRLALRALGCAPQPFGVLYRVLAPVALAPLLKALPWIGWFAAAGAHFALSSALVARAHALRPRTAALAVVGSFLALVGLVAAGATLAHWLLT